VELYQSVDFAWIFIRPLSYILLFYMFKLFRVTVPCTICISINYFRIPKDSDESLYRGYCVPTDGSYRVEPYCDCMQGEIAVCQEGVDLMSCVEVERRRGLLNKIRGL
jgi:hypothetical protein